MARAGSHGRNGWHEFCVARRDAGAAWLRRRRGAAERPHSACRSGDPAPGSPLLFPLRQLPRSVCGTVLARFHAAYGGWVGLHDDMASTVDALYAAAVGQTGWHAALDCVLDVMG